MGISTNADTSRPDPTAQPAASRTLRWRPRTTARITNAIAATSSSAPTLASWRVRSASVKPKMNAPIAVGTTIQLPKTTVAMPMNPRPPV